MFTGLVQSIGSVRALERLKDGLRLEIETVMDLSSVQIGTSISCAGCCLTAVEKSVDSFCVDVSAETLRRTTLGSWNTQTRVNLEPSLKMGDELGGHFVFGHVDDVVEILNITSEGASQRIEIMLPPALVHLVAEKGSVSVDGVSLTVNSVTKNSFSVNIIPHTWEKTTLGMLKAGDKVNLEVDMLARYVARMVGK